jgi:hypothetical protein
LISFFLPVTFLVEYEYKRGRRKAKTIHPFAVQVGRKNNPRQAQLDDSAYTPPPTIPQSPTPLDSSEPEALAGRLDPNPAPWR